MMQFYQTQRGSVGTDNLLTEKQFSKSKNRNISFPWCATDLIMKSVLANIISAGESIIRALIFLLAFFSIVQGIQ